MNENRVIEKLRAIEALIAGGATEGEIVAAQNAQERLLSRLLAVQAEDPPVEYQFSMEDMWAQRVFVALVRRYGLRPYRRRGQRHTTVMVRVSERFVDETLWPHFQQLSQALRAYLSEVTDRIVAEVIDADLSEPSIEHGRHGLPLGQPAPQSVASGAASGPRAPKSKPDSGPHDPVSTTGARDTSSYGGDPAARQHAAKGGSQETAKGRTGRNKSKRRRKNRRR